MLRISKGMVASTTIPRSRIWFKSSAHGARYGYVRAALTTTASPDGTTTTTPSVVDNGASPNTKHHTTTTTNKGFRISKSLLRHYHKHTQQPHSYSSSVENERLIVVGSGVAGCSAALVAAERHGIPVTLIYAGSLPTDCNSYWAQGGIIYRNYDPASNDSAESLVADVKRAGAGLCDDAAVWKVALEGPDRVRELLLDDSERGVFANVPFDRNKDGSLSCCLEASHAAPRIIHFSDHTGKAITDHITAAALRHPLITIIPNTIVTDLVTSTVSYNHKNETLCLGTHLLNKVTRQRETIYANYGTVLATGGLGSIYEHSTNPPGFNALGSSTALATRAGAHTSDLEYVQFHPTALYIPNESRFLLTEALRGEGAILRDATGRAFAKDFHTDGELAPRDIVARGVFNEAQKVDTHHNVFLDITHRDADWLRKRFPSINAYLQKRGLDITRDLLPITPAAHYTCGGITTDLHGRTSIMGLYSAGEAARTGLHGGNRLASTSLLEGLVYGAAVGDCVGLTDEGREAYHIVKESIAHLTRHNNHHYAYHGNSFSLDNDLVNRNIQHAHILLSKLRRIMWDHVGVVRTPRGLSLAATLLQDIQEEACFMFEQTPVAEIAALRDGAYSGLAVSKAALKNRVSAGAHCIILESPDATDHDILPKWVVVQGDEVSYSDDERQVAWSGL